VVSDIGYLEITPALDSYSAEIEDQDYYFTETTTCPDYPELNGTSQERFGHFKPWIRMETRTDR
jgi:hypothetical protein